MQHHIKQYTSDFKDVIRQKYDNFVDTYALREPMLEVLSGLGKLRGKLLKKASGKVLEIAVGTGVNLSYYKPECDVTAVDISPVMLDIARRRAEKLGLNVKFHIEDAESLDFPDESFDTVVTSLALCTFPDPITALQEMARVCKSDGKLLLLEHGRSDWKWIGCWQDLKAEEHAKRLGCYWNREPIELVELAGLKIIENQRCHFGMYHTIEAHR